MIVADASALVAALLRVEPGVAERVLLRSDEIHAPHLIDLEVLSVVRKLANRGRLTVPLAEAVLDDFRGMPLVRYSHDLIMPRAWDLRANLTPYDAAYVALAELLDAPLLTRDRRLANAPGHGARVEIV